MYKDPRVDWDFVEARDAAHEERMTRRTVKQNLQDVINRVPGTKISAALAMHWWNETRNRKPDADDRKNARQMALQGFENSLIGCALELAPERVIEALA